MVITTGILFLQIGIPSKLKDLGKAGIQKSRLGHEIVVTYDSLKGDVIGPVSENRHRITSAFDVEGEVIPRDQYHAIGVKGGPRVVWVPVPESSPDFWKMENPHYSLH